MQDQRPSESGPRPKRRRRRLLIFLAILIIAYPLSIGPVVRLEFAHYLPNHTSDYLYAPLAPLVGESGPLHELLLWYIYVVWRTPFPDLH
jgi:hypothetical protein